jgi:hypothetical protein
MYESSTAIFISCVMSLIVAVLYIYLLSAFAELLAWLMIAVAEISLLGGAALCFYKRSLSSDPTSKIKLLRGGISLRVAALLFGLCVFCGFNSLKQAIDIIDECLKR